MPETFGFSPNSQVASIVPREAGGGINLNGWQFSSRPTSPFQRRFKVVLHGLRWYLNGTTGYFDTTTAPTLNARLLEEFYSRHETWQEFNWYHPHLNTTFLVKFANPVIVPPGAVNSGGFIEPLEVMFIESNPGYP